MFRKGRKRPVERAQCMGNTKGGSCGAVCHCSVLTTVRLWCERRQSDGEVDACAVCVLPWHAWGVRVWAMVPTDAW